MLVWLAGVFLLAAAAAVVGQFFVSPARRARLSAACPLLLALGLLVQSIHTHHVLEDSRARAFEELRRDDLPPQIRASLEEDLLTSRTGANLFISTMAGVLIGAGVMLLARPRPTE